MRITDISNFLNWIRVETEYRADYKYYLLLKVQTNYIWTLLVYDMIVITANYYLKKK